MVPYEDRLGEHPSRKGQEARDELRSPMLHMRCKAQIENEEDYQEVREARSSRSTDTVQIWYNYHIEKPRLFHTGRRRGETEWKRK